MRPKIKDLSDYRDFYIVSKDAAVKQIENAEKFIKKMEEFIKTKVKASRESIAEKKPEL